MSEVENSKAYLSRLIGFARRDDIALWIDNHTQFNEYSPGWKPDGILTSEPNYVARRFTRLGGRRQMLSYPELKGLRILVVEDDWVLSKLAEDTVAELGCVVSGTAASVDEALAAIDNPHSFDCVILDVRLGQEIAGDIAGKLISKNIPFIVCSGYSISPPGANIPVVTKPYSLESLAMALLTAWKKHAAGESPRI